MDVLPGGLGAADLQSAYNLPSAAAGGGRTVAIVDAYDQPNAGADLAAYRAQYGLPAINPWGGSSTPSPWFRKVDQAGGTNYPTVDNGWGLEISLDIDMVSAICPNCNILLVEARSASMTDLGTAVNEAAALGATAISNSYIGGESVFENLFYDPYYNHAGIAITAASGDSGYGTGYPAASPYVTAVGGTTLTRGADGWTETAWSGAGSGCSGYESKPVWQKDAGCGRRTIADVSAVSSIDSPVAVYDTSGYAGWIQVYGTSVATPIIASVYALAGMPAAGTNPASYPYADTGALNDVTSGSNGTCSPSYLCTAGPGFDGPTGLGTPKGVAAFRAPGAPPSDFSLSASPSSQSVVAGSAASYTVTVSPSNGFTSSVALDASGLPAGAGATFSPNPVTGGSGTSSLTITTSSTTPAGTYPVTITGTATSATHTTSVSLTVTAPVVDDFSISANPTSVTVVQGTSGATTISTAVVSGSAESVTLSVSSPLPSGVTATFSANPVTAGGSSTLALVVGSSATPGTYALTVRGAAASAAHETPVSLTVTPAAATPDFSLAVSPASASVRAGGNASYSVSVTLLNGFTGSVRLSVAGQPAGATVSFRPNPTRTSSTLKVGVPRSAAAGTYTLTITGVSGALSHTTSVTLAVRAR